MTLSRRFFLFLSAAAVSAATLAPLSASAAPEDYSGARRFIKQHHEALLTSMKKSANPKDNPELLRLLDEMLDYDHFVRQSLGASWDGLSDAQRQRFGEILRGLIRGSYRKNLKDLTGYDVAYTGETDGTDGVLVATMASDPKKKRSEPLRIDYLVGKVEGQPRVRDIITGGVSLLQNYRRQFARIMKKDGADALLTKMQAQLDKLDAPAG